MLNEVLLNASVLSINTAVEHAAAEESYLMQPLQVSH